MIIKKFQIINPYNMHLYNANELVSSLAPLRSLIVFKDVYANKNVNPKSIISLLSLGLTKESVLEVKIAGEDEKIAEKYIVSFFRKYGLI